MERWFLVISNALLTGILTWLVVRWLQGYRAVKTTATAEARCACKHLRCMHKEDGSGACNVAGEIGLYKEGHGEARTGRGSPCACLRYTGPIPVSALFTPKGFLED